MPIFAGKFENIGLLVHGGAGPGDPSPERRKKKDQEAVKAAQKGQEVLSGGGSAREAVLAAVEYLEVCPLFNAGRGGSLQNDGVARLSASFMDGNTQTFSAVSLIENVINPSKLAAELQTRSGRSLGALGAENLAQEMRIPRESPVTPEALEIWNKTKKDIQLRSTGTVGAVARDRQGLLAACASTGGFATDLPGRMSDVSTVAGNFASQWAAVSCTGHGERIIDVGLAVRIESRVRDGMSLEAACKKAIQEAAERNDGYGWISIDRFGNWVSTFTTPDMVWVKGGE